MKKNQRKKKDRKGDHIPGDYMPINKWPESERPREKLIKYGSEYLTNSELLAIILRTGTNNKKGSRSALDISKSLLSGYKNLNELLDASVAELTGVSGIGTAKACQIIAALELGKRAVSEKNGNNKSFRCSEEVANYYIPLLKDLKKEQFRVLLLDVKNKLIK
ncbi:MAG: JAB domain-containing protein, partial [Actinomycetota bacterium]|nr:JAB domain-containing protein [Actinomycetota bacterium]